MTEENQMVILKKEDKVFVEFYDNFGEYNSMCELIYNDVFLSGNYDKKFKRFYPVVGYDDKGRHAIVNKFDVEGTKKAIKLALFEALSNGLDPLKFVNEPEKKERPKDPFTNEALNSNPEKPDYSELFEIKKEG